MSSRKKSEYRRVLEEVTREIPFVLLGVLFGPLGVLAFLATVAWFWRHWGEGQLLANFFSENTQFFTGGGLFLFWVVTSTYIFESVEYFNPSGGEQIKLGNFQPSEANGTVATLIWGVIVGVFASIYFDWS